MKPGDRWELYIPYECGYGSTDQVDYYTGKTTIPAYSFLIFDITLVSFEE